MGEVVHTHIQKPLVPDVIARRVFVHRQHPGNYFLGGCQHHHTRVENPGKLVVCSQNACELLRLFLRVGSAGHFCQWQAAIKEVVDVAHHHGVGVHVDYPRVVCQAPEVHLCVPSLYMTMHGK